MSVPWCVIEYSGNRYEVDGVARVLGPYDEDEAKAIAANPPPASEWGAGPTAYPASGWSGRTGFAAFPMEGVPTTEDIPA